MLAVVLSNKEDWDVYPEEIARRMDVSRQYINKQFKALEELGYLFVIRKGRGRAQGAKNFRFFSDMPFTETFKDYIRQNLEKELSSKN